jgi:hypothetical protein
MTFDLALEARMRLNDACTVNFLLVNTIVWESMHAKEWKDDLKSKY